MPTTTPAPYVLTLRGPLLSRDSIAHISGQIAAKEARDAVALILDCHAISSVTAGGLRAFLALPDQHRDRRWVIVSAGRALLRAAVQTDLAQRFEFWTTARRLPECAPGARVMHALIYEAGTRGAPSWDIAGRPLLMRQLQWLRDNGLSKVVIEVCAGLHAARLSEWLFSSDPLLTEAVVVPSGAPLGAVELARRAGLTGDELVLALPSDVLVQCRLPSPAQPLRYQLSAPAGFVGPRLEIAIEPLTGEREPAEPSSGWAIRLATIQDAHKLSCAVLTGAAPGVLVHASELRPGVWIGRGASIASSAKLRAPVLIGAFARVGPNAEVGPRSMVNSGAVVGGSAVLSDVVVESETLVGEGFSARGSLLAADHIVDLRDGTTQQAHDSLDLASVSAARRVNLSSRLFALVALLWLLAPWLVATLLWSAFRPSVKRLTPRKLYTGDLGLPVLDAFPRLFDVLVGRRTLLGPVDTQLLAALQPGPSPMAGALDVVPMLCADASQEDRLRLLRWYALNKGRALDFRLWLGRDG